MVILINFLRWVLLRSSETRGFTTKFEATSRSSARRWSLRFIPSTTTSATSFSQAVSDLCINIIVFTYLGLHFWHMSGLKNYLLSCWPGWSKWNLTAILLRASSCLKNSGFSEVPKRKLLAGLPPLLPKKQECESISRWFLKTFACSTRRGCF